MPDYQLVDLRDVVRQSAATICSANLAYVAAHSTEASTAGPDGLAAGEISERMGMPPNALSFHLPRLVQADLVTSRRAGRQIFYAVEYERLRGLLNFLLEDCCANAPSGCMPGCPTTPIDAAVEAKGKPTPCGSKGQRS